MTRYVGIVKEKLCKITFTLHKNNVEKPNEPTQMNVFQTDWTYFWK